MKTIFVSLRRPHPSHKGLADSIGSEFISFTNFRFGPDLITPINIIEIIVNGLKLPKYDVYLCEGLLLTLPILAKKMMGYKKGKVIVLLAESNLIVATLGMPKAKHVRKKLWKLSSKMLWKIAPKYIDGAIAVSKFMKEEASKVLSGPIRIAHPYVRDEVYEALRNTAPSLESHNIVFVGEGKPENGINVLLDAFKIVKKDFFDANLCIIGKNHSEKWNKIDGVHVEGFVNDFVPYFQKSSLFCLIGAGQPFPVAVLEALCAGLPTIVSKYTGSKEIVKKIGKEFIAELDPEDVANRIIWYFSLSEREKKEISKKAKEISKSFNKKERCEKFQREFELLMSEIS